jgi:two-component system, NarL family, response regulator LiaR
MIRIVICDDHPLVRQGLRNLLDLHDDMAVVGEASQGREALALVESERPDVLLLDLMMPVLDGLGVMQAIQAARLPTKVILLTSFLDAEKAIACIEAGALGYLTKDVQPAELVDAIRAVYRGEPRLHPEVTKRLIFRAAHPSPARARESLTARELDVVKCLAQGMTNREIGEKLLISETTVKTHISSILSKLHLADRTQIALWAVREKLLD